jgi:holliday junction DNA helicase RuvA
MIGYIKGTVKFIDQFYAIIYTGTGVGYEVEVGGDFFLEVGSETELWIHTHVRENEIKLFGFSSLEKRQLFEQLTTVSGVGAKTAHAITSQLSPDEIRTAILMGEAKTFTKVSGVGKKVSERILLELKDKLADISIKSATDNVTIDQSSTNNTNDLAEVFEALTALGYDSNSIRTALKDLDTNLPSKELIKLCLKIIKN